MLIIGIDPGKSGGVAWVCDGWSEPLAEKMPETVHEVVALFERIADEGEQIKCYLEKVHSMPKQGVTSVFTFGRGLGNLEGILAALKIPFEWVTPQAWQKRIGCMSKGDKNVTKAKAAELFPRTRFTHATADCSLICEYGRRTEAGQRVAAEVVT
jgi:crossover junction endodeoxyribonuclease RuvC